MPADASSQQFPQLTAAPHDRRWLDGRESFSDKEARSLFVRLKSLYALAHEVYRSQDFESISSWALDFFQSVLTPERAIVSIKTADGSLSVQSRGIVAGSDPTRWAVSQNLLRRVIDEHLAILSTDAREDAILGKFESVEVLSIRSVLCVPLGDARNSRGLIYLDSRAATGVFDENDLYFLTTVCRLLDAAIESIDRFVDHGRQAARQEKQITLLKEELFKKHRVVGQSRALLVAYDQLKKIASKTDIPILLLGESGTGKEQFARAAHYDSARQAGAFVPVNLAAVGVELVESELFGHVKGAFTGATVDRVGLIEQADGGTLFLDEVADIPSAVQVKLLRVLQEKVFTKVGCNKVIKSNFRLISATSRDIANMTEESKFRDDLLGRLEGITILLPALRERADDIPLLVDFFLQQTEPTKTFSRTALQFLMVQPWPRNVRQLQHCVIAAAAMCESDTIGIRDIELVLRVDRVKSKCNEEPLADIAELLRSTERAHMLKALDQSGGNATQAAKLIGMSKATFSEKRKRYGI